MKTLIFSLIIILLISCKSNENNSTQDITNYDFSLSEVDATIDYMNKNGIEINQATMDYLNHCRNTPKGTPFHADSCAASSNIYFKIDSIKYE